MVIGSFIGSYGRRTDDRMRKQLSFDIVRRFIRSIVFDFRNGIVFRFRDGIRIS